MTTTTLAQLDTRHTGKTIRLDDLTGTLQGVISVADRVQLAVITGPTRIWTDWYPADTQIEVGVNLEPTCCWCDANRHERCRGTDGCGCPCARRDEHP